MQRNFVKTCVWSLMICLNIGMIGTGPQAAAQSLEEEIYKRLKAAGTLDDLGSQAGEITAIEFVVEPNWTLSRTTIDNVTTKKSDKPLILAEQYSTNCSAEDMERTFSFSKSKERSEEVNFQRSGGFGFEVGRESATETEAGVGAAKAKTTITWSAKLSGHIEWAVGDSQTDTESTTWEDSVSTTVAPGTIGRARLLVTENRADVDFTDYHRVDGLITPVYSTENRVPPEVCFYSAYGLRGGTGGKADCNSEASGEPAPEVLDDGVSSLIFKGTCAWYQFISNDSQSSLIYAWQDDDMGCIEPPTVTITDEETKVKTTIGDHLDDLVTPTLEKPTDNYGDFIGWKVADFGEKRTSWNNNIYYFYHIDLSKPYACFYPDENYKINSDYGDKLPRIRCFNAMAEEADGEKLRKTYADIFSSAIIHKDLVVQVWTDLEGQPITLTSEDSAENIAGLEDIDHTWYTIPYFGESGQTDLNELNNRIKKIKVTYKEPKGIQLSSLLDGTQREFSVKGKYKNVSQTNSRAEVVSEPATYEVCECANYPEREVCMSTGDGDGNDDDEVRLSLVPRAVTVKVLGEGMIEYGNYYYRDECRINFQEGKQLTKTLKAIPRLGSAFLEWRDPSGNPISSQYTPSGGEILYAVFVSEEAAGKYKTLRVEVTGDAHADASAAKVSVQEFGCLSEGQWQRVMLDDSRISWMGNWTTDGNGKTSASQGDSAEFRCKGDAAMTVLGEGPNAGIARIVINGQPAKMIDAYAENSGTVIYDSREKTVRLTIPPSDTKDVLVRYFKYMDDNGTWRDPLWIENDNPAILRVPEGIAEGSHLGWRPGKPGGLYTKKSGAYIEFSFVGKAATVTLNTGTASRGKIEVAVNGKSKGLLDTLRRILADIDGDGNSDGWKDQEFTLYVEGEQTVRIENAGRRNSASGGYTIGLHDVTYQTYQHWRIKKHGNWSDDAWTTDELGASIELTGTLTTIDLKTGPNFGVATISVDGESQQEIDLYSEEAGSKSIDLNTW